MSDPQQEYTDALTAYRDALARLQEAKRHIPPSPQDRRRQRIREERAAERAHYLANKEAIDAQHGEWVNRITAKALAILHQKVNSITAQDNATKIGSTFRIRLPIDYRITGNDDE
jgi:hypothetical protein